MKKLLFFVLFVTMTMAIQAQVRVIMPESISEMPKMSVEEWEQLCDSEDFDEENYDVLRYGDLSIYDDLYSSKCSWYCGGEVQQVTASSCLPRYKAFTYEGENAHDFNHESVWATKGKGIGESLTYTFRGGCPRITTVKILNGHVKNETAWKNNSRVKRLLMYYNERPYAILALQNSRTLQCFDVGIVGFNDPQKPDWTLKFEILDVYPGAKYEDTVIAELYFDGIDVH